MILYGIPNCDTCRMARAALAAAGHAVTFRDIRAEPLNRAERAEFLAAFGDGLINRASATWRGLDSQARAAAGAGAAMAAAEVLAAHPTLMRRPVIRAGGRLHLGWTAETRAALLK
ncbi:arsenate reductase family protein [Albidovulum sp.]|uniref:arsenate reductase family protein n=1 Tax=Albidovulum sp. TaxID=1872424 RepID=UPI0039B90909